MTSTSKSDSPSQISGAKVSKFKGSGSHEFMLWLSEWKKYLVYHGIHRIILEGLDSQGKSHREESTDFKVDEIEFFMNFWNTSILSEKSEETKIVKDLISQEFPWIWGYYSQKQITIGSTMMDSIPIEAPDWDDTHYALKVLLEQANDVTDLPFPKLFVGQTQAELNARLAHTAQLTAALNGNDPDDAAEANRELVAEAISICEYQLHDRTKRVLVTDAIKATAAIVEQRLMNRQFKNDDELHADQLLVIAKKPECKDFNKYIKVKLGPSWAIYDKELREAHFASEKRAHKSNEQSQRCLDAMALLGDIKHIPDAEEALKRKDYHRCFLAVDNYYMRSGGQDVGRFRKEAESFRLQPGQDLNSHLELMRSSIERWLNIEFMEQKSLQLSATAASADPRLNHGASIFILNHPEVAFDNSLDLTDAEILAKGEPSIVLLSEAKRFTLYADSVKSSPRFKDIVSAMHAADPSTRTVRSLLQSLRNYELSTSGKDDLEKERSQNPNYKKDIKSYLALVHGTNEELPHSDSKEKKSVHFTSKVESSHGKSSKGRTTKYPKNQSEVEDGDIPYCKNHPKTSTHWTWECFKTIAETKAAAKGTQQKSWQKASSQNTSPAVKGCAWCFNDDALRGKSLTHFTKDCRLDPKNKKNQKDASSSARKDSKTSNLHLKDAIRDVLNEPAEKGPKAKKKRNRGDKSESESDSESDHSSDDIHPKGKSRK